MPVPVKVNDDKMAIEQSWLMHNCPHATHVRKPAMFRRATLTSFYGLSYI